MSNKADSDQASIIEIQQREVGTKAGRVLTVGSSYLPERNSGITKSTWFNPHASAWEITEGYEDKIMDVCALKNEEYCLRAA